jgi:hypothetical protein
MKHRLLLAFLLAMTLVYYAMPYLSLQLNNMHGYFSVAWLLFALLVVGGNLSGFLYTRQEKRRAPTRYERYKVKQSKYRRQRMN